MAGDGKFTFQLNGKLTLFSLLLLPILLSLGFWQLSRAQEKLTLQESWQTQQALPPKAYSPDDRQIDSRRVYVEGRFNTQHYWLLEHRMLDGRLGYEVVMAFSLTHEGDTLLVNRGWVPAGQYREDNPTLTTPKGTIRIAGTLKIPSDSAFIEQAKSLRQSWPQRLLEVDVELMAQQVQHSLAKNILLLDADSPGALLTNWQPINMSAEKHWGYAVQWFAMALALCILWVFSNSNVWTLIKSKK